jgi:hypothetical protein
MEHWTHWHPFENISAGRYLIDSVALSKKNIIIQLTSNDETKKLELLFENADAYRLTNESWCFMIFAELTEQYGIKFYSQWNFFKITDSEYIKSVCAQSKSAQEKLQHFCILGTDEALDIVAHSEPKINIIKQ